MPASTLDCKDEERCILRLARYGISSHAGFRHPASLEQYGSETPIHSDTPVPSVVRGFLMAGLLLLKSRTDHQANAEDLFADTRMPFGDHLEDLRVHLWRALIGFGGALLLVFALDFAGYATGTKIGIGKPVMAFIAKPVEEELERFYRRRVERVLTNLERDPALERANWPTPFYRIGFSRDQFLAALQKEPASGVNNFPRPRLEDEGQTGNELESKGLAVERIYKFWVRAEEPLREAAYRQEAERQVGRRPILATMGMMEGMMVYLQVAMACGIVLACPWIFWQAWSFVAAGLYPHEKRPVLLYLPLSIGLLAAGILVCQVWIIPKAVETLLGFNEWLDLEPELRLKEWLGFALWMPLAFGLSFQTPLVMLLLERLGLFMIDDYRRRRRLAWFFMAVIAGIVTPPFDVMSMLFLWVVLGVLYELGILCCGWSCKVSGTKDEVQADPRIS